MRAVAFVLLLAAGCSGQASGTVIGKKGGDAGVHGDGGIALADMAYDTTSCIGGGTDCQTGAPGACNDSIVTCNGTQAMCTMKSTVQSCYDGPANTQGVGVCTAGTQSCNGPALGACEGEILPATKEDCSNDADDDCDGTINNTCPSGAVTLTNARNVAPYAGGDDTMIANNTNVTAQCPANAFVSSLVIEFNDVESQVAGLRLGCSTITLSAGATGYTATLTNLTPSPYVSLIASGDDGTGTPITLNCENTTGLRGIWAMKGSYDVGGMLGFFAECGAAAITQNADNSLSIAMTATAGAGTMQDAQGYTGFEHATASNPPLTHSSATWSCAATEVVVGFKGNVSPNCGSSSDGVALSCLNNVQPICATITPSYL